MVGAGIQSVSGKSFLHMTTKNTHSRTVLDHAGGDEKALGAHPHGRWLEG